MQMKKIIACVREYRPQVFLTFVFIVVEALIETYIPTLTAELVNSIQSENIAIKGIAQIGIKLFIMAVISLCCGGLAGFTCSKASAGFAKNLRHDIFEKIQDFSFENIDKFSTSSLVTRLTTDITNIQMAFMMLIRLAVRAPLMITFSIIMGYRIGGNLAFTFVVIIPVLIMGFILIGSLALPAFRRVFKRYDRLNESIEENIRGMRVVKGFSREEYEKKKFNTEADSIRKDFTFAERVVALNSPIMVLCLNFNLVFILVMGSKYILNHETFMVFGRAVSMGVGQITAMLSYAFQSLMSLMMLSIVFVIVTISIESIKRVNQVLSEESTLTNPDSPVMKVEKGSIDFNHVDFKYSEKAKKNSLSDIDIHIESGMTVGIIGGTGSGKSSLVQLIPRLYDATQGSVMVGGIDVKEYDLKTLRDSVAMVLQKNLIFSGTIAENLRWGNSEATDEELIEACRLAQADEFISSFPEGYNTMIEQGGTNVSGGQKQRLCIARALLKKPAILILDDSTSAVDTKTDSLIRQGFRSFIPETTKIIIAQRISSVQDADMILVMDDGRVTASGTHDELLESSDIYREVYTQQTSGGDFDAQ